MKFKVLITALALALALPAAAQFRTIKEAYEVVLSDLRLPQSEAGTIAFKTCDACDYRTKRISADTRWVLNGRVVTLAKFRAGVARIADRDTEYATVVHHLEDDRIIRVSISVP